MTYPLGLPSASLSPSEAELAAVRLLLRRPFESAGARDGIFRFGPVHLSRKERRLLYRNHASYRVFPDLAGMPPFRGGRPERVVFVIGKHRNSANVSEIRARLSEECGISPFLAVQDSTRALLAMLSPAPTSQPSPPLPILSEYVSSIEIVREPVITLFPIVDHRYDRLVL
jgi:hypothetical protein